MDDVLDRSIRAYREENPGTALDANAVRRRILVGAGVRRHRRLFFVRFAVPIAATFCVSVAVAASHGGLPRLDDVREWLGIAETQASATTAAPEHFRSAPVARPEAPATAPAIVPSAPVEAPPESEPPAEPVPVPVLERRTSPAPLPRATSPVPAPPRGSLAPAEPRPEGTSRVPDTRPNLLTADLAHYEQAHRLHFHGADPAAALRAWDAYLARYPAGTFAPEARFNRAVCLLRLGRRAEAKGILTPIAESSFAYGRERARALLTAME
jgi:TolA-binding protein